MVLIQIILYTELNIFALIVLVLIYYNISHRADRHLMGQRLFIGLLGCNALILVLDTAMWVLDGKPGVLVRALLLFVTACYYSLNPLICMVWCFYIDFQVYGNEQHLNKLFVPMLIPVCINFLLSFLSLLNGRMFYFDDNNVYHRGLWFLLMAVISYTYLLHSLFVVIRRQRRLPRYEFFPFLTFYILPFIAGIVQTLFYGVSFIWVCVTISILIVYFNIQNLQLCTDYLTGLYNRRQLDCYIQKLMHRSGERRLLAGIMIDLNSFKAINDLYGHDVGDEALKHTARILKKTFRRNDFIARYGGDEFVIVMNVKDRSAIKKAVLRLRENVDQFNNQKASPYTLSLSIGHDIYDEICGFTFHDFLKHIDDLMYQEKQNYSGYLEKAAQ